jgi:hypothetical protein
VILSATAAPVELSVEVGRARAVAGSDLDLVVGARASRDVEVTGVEVDLVVRMRFIHREAGLLGTASMTRSTRTEVPDSREVPGPWPLAQGEAVRLPLQLHVPQGAPGTTRSDLVEIDWSVRVRLHAVGHTYAEARRSITVLTAAPDRVHVALTPPVVQTRGVAELSFDAVPSRFLVPGRALSGTLGITPLRPEVVRAARVALVLRQVVLRGEWIGDDPSRNPAYQENERDTQLASATLAEGLELVPGQPVGLDFVLPVRTSLPAPSVGTPPFTVSWILRGVLERRWRRSPFVELELHGRTLPG